MPARRRWLVLRLVDCSNFRVINYVPSEFAQLDERHMIRGLEHLVGSEELFEGTLAPFVVKSLRRIGGAGQVKLPYRLIS